ncbi:MAG: AMP-binding protein [Lachnospiraceae bacterium]|nr:AMP-binding protein [Lachnospiraceae bacterium]
MSTVRELWDNSYSKFADFCAVRWLEKKDIKERSYRELGDKVTAIRKGLGAEGFKGAHISLIGTASVSWIEAYLGITTGDNVAVPLDAGLPAEDLIALLNDSDAEALFLIPKGKALAGAVKAACPKIRKIWLLEEEPAEDVATLHDLVTASEGADDVAGSAADDVATIIYTSGTTGKSKGVMLTQHNLCQNIASVPVDFGPGFNILSVLPIHHAFCLVMDWLKCFSLGATVAINDSFMHMIRNIGIFKPDAMLMVPLMVETIYKKLSSMDQSIPKETVAANVFGGNLKIIFAGGAHLDPFYIDRMKEYGVQVLEGYGMSECSPVISFNSPKDHRDGSIGKPLSNVELRFENGEIQVRGSSVMKGYYKMPAETAEALKDGWLHTGDKGYLDEDGFLFINGRVKNLIILSNGENISPEEIENKLGIDSLVGEVLVTGDNNGLTARIYPDQDVIKAAGLDEEKIKAGLDMIIKQYNKMQPSYRQIVSLCIRKNPFHRNATGKIVRADAEVDEA